MNYALINSCSNAQYIPQDKVKVKYFRSLYILIQNISLVNCLGEDTYVQPTNLKIVKILKIDTVVIGYIFKTKNKLIIVFGSSTTQYQLIQSLNIQLTDLCKIVKQDIVWINGTEEIIIAGIYLIKYQPSVISFAGPRVLSTHTAMRIDKLKLPIYRICNTEDVITDLPLSIYMGLLYSHVGKVRTFTLNLNDYFLNHTIKIICILVT